MSGRVGPGAREAGFQMRAIGMCYMSGPREKSSGETVKRSHQEVRVGLQEGVRGAGQPWSGGCSSGHRGLGAGKEAEEHMAAVPVADAEAQRGKSRHPPEGATSQVGARAGV